MLSPHLGRGEEPPRIDAVQAEKRKQEAAGEEVEVELSQQMEVLTSPSKPPAPKKLKIGGDEVLLHRH